MAQTAVLINVLKKALKAHGKTYADTAKYLGISEASVKRAFSQKSFTLHRLDEICQMLGIEFTDLLQMVKDSAAAPISGLTLEQEKEIVGDLELLLTSVYVMNTPPAKAGGFRLRLKAGHFA
jgi:DNA-binding Xre family transcriptional regulator